MRSSFLIIALTLFAATTALAQDNPQPTIKISETQSVSGSLEADGSQLSSSNVDNSRRLAMHEELRTAREQVKTQVLNLSAQITSNTSSDERMNLQRQVMRLKSDSTLQSMNIQLKYARLGDFTEQTEQLEADIEMFETRRDAPRSSVNSTSNRQNSARGGEVR